MNKFTGQKDVDIKILNLLEDKELVATCKTNKYINSICDNDTFWRDRIVSKYGKEALNGVKGFNSYKEYYTSNSIKTYLLCNQIKNLPHHSRLVVDDFYSPYAGFINSSFTKDIQVLTYLLLKIVITRMSSFPSSHRNLEEEEKLKILLKIRYDLLPEYRRDGLDATQEVLTNEEKEIMMKLIDVAAARDQILRNLAKSNPGTVKALSPRPEDKFLLISYIHTGFRTGKIPLDILWDELCTLPYVLNFK